MRNISFMYLLLFATMAVSLSACKPTMYSMLTQTQNQSSVVLTKNNFKVLGTFTGVASARTATIGVKNREGVISEARKNLLQNAKSAGVELTGARTLTNVSVDAVNNLRRVTVTITADIIEFTGQ